MTTLAKANVLTRDAVEKLEHRFGRKRLYWGGGLIVLIALLLTLRTIANRPKPNQTPGPRPVREAHSHPRPGRVAAPGGLGFPKQ